MRKGILLAVFALIVPFVFYGCSGSDGSQGAQGPAGATGPPGTPGAPNPVGTAKIDALHGEAAVAAEEAAAGVTFVTVTITGATADAAGVATVSFNVKKTSDNTLITDLTACTAGIFKLAPAGGGLSYNRWVPYIYRSGRTVNAGYRESTTSTPVHGTLVNNSNGNYTYTFGTNLSTATFAFPIDGQSLVGYERNRTHRVSIYMGGHSGPTGEGDFDFVPDGSAVTQTRNIVVTATCKKCHGPEFAGHGGDRVTVEGCNGCHSPNSALVNSAANGGTTESIEMAVMIHKIHAGRELPSSKGPDGSFYDNPNTVDNEVADNYQRFGAPYAYTVGNIKATWRTAAFPAVLENCTVCHTGGGANVDNWKNVPSRAACGSCHDTIDWVTGAGHPDGAAPDDSACTACHPATGAGEGQSVTTAHDWTTKDIRNIPEFNVSLTVSTPANGQYFVKGETPVISIALTDKFTGAVVVPATVIEDGSGEGCVPLAGSEGTQCTVARDGLFRAASIYVTGPRAQRIPVLTYPARAAVWSETIGPWNVSAGDNMVLSIDSGMDMLTYDTAWEYEGYGADILTPGNFTVKIPTADNTHFVDNTAATAAEIAAFLNADKTFKQRAFAYVDEALAGNSKAGKLAIRSRGISKMKLSATGDPEPLTNTAQPNVKVVSDTVGIFAANKFGAAGGAAQGRIRTTANATDPKANFTGATAITYTLDPVDDLAPGTYVINIEFGDAGRGPGNAAEPPYVDYRTPTVAVTTFQVKQAAVEKPIAASCTSCHWNTTGAGGAGFVLDFPRHDKLFNYQAVDQCGGCHMYKSAMDPATTTALEFGTKPLSRRVHAVHNGANLNYPTLTVGHEETAAFGRNWNITYPQEIRNCESCHPSTTSGTWKTNPNRLACMGCHDSDAATAHMKAMTNDPTPLAPFSGDETESCKACH